MGANPPWSEQQKWGKDPGFLTLPFEAERWVEPLKGTRGSFANSESLRFSPFWNKPQCS